MLYRIVASKKIAAVPTTVLPGFVRVAAKIAPLSNDDHTGEDYLELDADVSAFAKIIASQSFNPPLSIGLFGKWGSGKSFFMHKLDQEIRRLSDSSPGGLYRSGIAQIHFNAWSYMDANLWASIVSRIFEGLDQYIKNDKSEAAQKGEIKSTLNQELVITSEKLEQIASKKKAAEDLLKVLKNDKTTIESDLQGKLKQIKDASLTDALDDINREFNVWAKIGPMIADDPELQQSVSQLRNVIPTGYWENPELILKKGRSAYSWLRFFFHRDRVWKNLGFLLIIVLGLWVIPYIVELLASIVDMHLLPVLRNLAFAVTLLIPLWIRIKKVSDQYFPVIAKFWQIRESYIDRVADAERNADLMVKALELEIQAVEQKLLILEDQIKTTNEEIAVLNFKSDHALATEALYSFIEKRCSSEEYQKHLGIVSIIRKDFQVLSGLFTDHQSEYDSSVNVAAFRKLFNRPLQRIVLYIDDLDRCPQDRVMEVLEAVNLLMAFPLFVVIVGVDQRWVKKAIDKERELDNEHVSAADYLEKIFQVPFHLRQPEDEQVKHMLAALTMSRAVADPVVVRDPLIETITEVPERISEMISERMENNDEIMGSVVANIGDEVTETLHLEISDKERELILTMSDVIGNNPRAIKRFVNIYHIVRAHEGLEHLQGDEERAFSVVMFLLAVATGRFKDLAPVMAGFFDDLDNHEKTLDQFLQTSIPGSDVEKLNEMRHLLRVKLADRSVFGNLLNEQVATFSKHNNFIRRFTFSK